MKSDRFTKLILSIIALTLIGLLVKDFRPGEKVIRAQSFELVDRQGKVQGRLAVKQDSGQIELLGESPSIILINRQENLRALLSVHEPSAFLKISGGEGYNRLFLGVEASPADKTQYEPFLMFKRKRDKAAARIVLEEKGGKLELLDGKGETRFSIP